MSELITAANIDWVIKKNNEIRDEVVGQTMKLQMNPEIMKVASIPQLALLILQGFGLIQIPIEDKFWSGAIFVKNGKIIPVLNTALPRANQYFAAWHEIYHLIFDKVSFDHFIERDNTMEERKAECLDLICYRLSQLVPNLYLPYRFLPRKCDSRCFCHPGSQCFLYALSFQCSYSYRRPAGYDRIKLTAERAAALKLVCSPYSF